jgi:hypothetical protein
VALALATVLQFLEVRLVREVRTQDGKVLYMPDQQRPRDDSYTCDCHRRMGNDFWFLPTESCLRSDGVCNKARGNG